MRVVEQIEQVWEFSVWLLSCEPRLRWGGGGKGGSISAPKWRAKGQMGAKERRVQMTCEAEDILIPLNDSNATR